MSLTSWARFGVMTAPSQVTYDDVLRVWREADMIPQIEHAWLYDHLMPIFGDPDGPTHEGLDAALGSRRPDRSGARADAEVEPPSRNYVDGRGDLGQHRRRSEAVASHQQPDP
jgi:hypothetical protein